ncbi:hypothetical protein [Bartonella sp. MF74HXZ]|uniref:hypothetical protein n=1 Tax=Bartonella sp. MF74HXZ TaxID=1461006 RepID=UPI0035CED544
MCFHVLAQSQGEYCNGSICDIILPVIKTMGDSLINKDLQMFFDGVEMRKIHRIEGFITIGKMMIISL